MKKFFEKYQVHITFYGIMVAIFVLGFVIGRYGRTASSLEAIERERYLQTQNVQSVAVTPPIEEPIIESPYTKMTVIATAYCPCEECSEGYGRMTSTGVLAKAGHTIAVDPSVIPYGTEVIIDGITYVAEDCGGAVKGNIVDIFFDTHEEVTKFGRRILEAEVK